MPFRAFHAGLARSARPLVSRASLVLALLASAACAPVTVSNGGDVADAGVTQKTGADAATSADGGGGGIEPDASLCTPGDVSTYHPVAHAPAVQPQACGGSIDRVDEFYAACLGSSRDDNACDAFRKANPDCAACIVTPESAMAYGPIIDHGTFVTPNVAGCIELGVEYGGDGGSAPLTCAQAVQALAGCELSACEANCPVSDTASLSEFEGCAESADGTGCTFASAAACLAPDSGVEIPSACQQTDFGAFYRGVVPLFCLPPATVDAGAGLLDAAAQAD
jgi:hypothetical protein